MAKKQPAAFPFPSQMCAWHGENNRCPLPGARKKGDRWLCFAHAQPEQFDGMEVWEQCNIRMEGRANQFHNELLLMFQAAMYFNDDGNLCMDHEALSRKKSKQPGWMQQCREQIADIVLSPMEKLSRGTITHAEFKQQNQPTKTGDEKNV